MLNHLLEHGMPLLSAAAIPAYRYMGEARYATLEYYSPGRTRTKAATLLLNLFATVAGSVSLARDVDRDELFERYDVKLWSFDDHIAVFALATIPSIVALATIYAAFRGVEVVRSAFSL